MSPATRQLVELDPAVKDKWAIPALRIHCSWGPNELALVEDIQATAAGITDGACVASSANQNPSITYMALTARACAYAVELLNRREL